MFRRRSAFPRNRNSYLLGKLRLTIDMREERRCEHWGQTLINYLCGQKKSSMQSSKLENVNKVYIPLKGVAMMHILVQSNMHSLLISARGRMVFLRYWYAWYYDIIISSYVLSPILLYTGDLGSVSWTCTWLNFRSNSPLLCLLIASLCFQLSKFP